MASELAIMWLPNLVFKQTEVSLEKHILPMTFIAPIFLSLLFYRRGSLSQFEASVTTGKPFDAIFMDFVMPNMDGPTATSVLRRRGYQGPIFGVTGNVMREDVEHFMAHGATAVMAKPLRTDTVVQLLQTAAES